MKKIIIEGKLTTISSGITTEGVHKVEFIEVGGQRYHQVLWSNFMDNFMQNAVGKNVRISVGKIGAIHCVGALEVDGKIEKEVNSKIVGYSQLGMGGIIMTCLVFLLYPGLIYRSTALIVGSGIAMVAWGYVGTKLRFNSVVNALDTMQARTPSVEKTS